MKGKFKMFTPVFFKENAGMAYNPLILEEFHDQESDYSHALPSVGDVVKCDADGPYEVKRRFFDYTHGLCLIELVKTKHIWPQL